MENYQFSFDIEERIGDSNNIDYSKYLKPKSNYTINIGTNFQANIPIIKEKEKKNDLNFKNYKNLKNDLFEKKRINKKRRLGEAKSVNKSLAIDNIISNIKKRKIEDSELN